ncbi:MAG TPA: hypothetical protein VMK32_12400 [Burkholderiaceae bacterium]|nr:hypothetical protein [Burkholderiaceae bacterium]
MADYGEPPGGDFVAYIEELQRESAARIGGAGGSITETAAPTHAASAPATTRPVTAPPVLNRQQADELLAGLARRRGRASPAGRVAFLLGLALLVLWFMTRASTLTLLIAVGLLVWGGLRLARRARPPDGSLADQVQHLFHPPPPPR